MFLKLIHYEPETLTMNRLIRSAAALAFALAATSGWAQAYPTKPIRVIVPFPAGGPVDQTARALGSRLSTSLGQSIIIDNKGGAGGLLDRKSVV